MTPIEKARAALKQEQSRREEFYEGAAYALKLAEAAQVGESEMPQNKTKNPKTNGDMVRAMSDEELAELAVCDHCCKMFLEAVEDKRCLGNCKKCALAWLRQEAER